MAVWICQDPLGSLDGLGEELWREKVGEGTGLERRESKDEQRKKFTSTARPAIILVALCVP